MFSSLSATFQHNDAVNVVQFFPLVDLDLRCSPRAATASSIEML